MNALPPNTRLKLPAPVLYSDGMKPSFLCCRIAFLKLKAWRRSLSAIR